MDEENYEDSGVNPFGVASLVLAFFGLVVYCCGSFVCLGWLGIFVWMLGLALGGVAVFQGGSGLSKGLGWVGIAANGLGLLFFVAVVGLSFAGALFAQLVEHL